MQGWLVKAGIINGTPIIPGLGVFHKLSSCLLDALTSRHARLRSRRFSHLSLLRPSDHRHHIQSFFYLSPPPVPPSSQLLQGSLGYYSFDCEQVFLAYDQAFDFHSVVLEGLWCAGLDGKIVGVDNLLDLGPFDNRVESRGDLRYMNDFSVNLWACWGLLRE